MTTGTTRLLWAVHCHQPVGNFDFVFEHAFNSAYLPFLETLERHPTIGVDFHFSGILLDWLDKHRPYYVDRLGKLINRGQVGLLAGAYYEPILPPIPHHDRVGQIRRLRERLLSRFGVEPKGMWLAERVWEPDLPAALAEAGIEFTLLDGTHFKQVGFSEDQMFGRWLTENQGKVVSVFPIHDGVRDLIPFASVESAVEALRRLAVPGGRDVVFGDDGEKFGDWPGTNALCYEQRWLDRFFEAVEADPSLSIRPVSEAFGSTQAQGMAYLPAASYFEMMEWAESAPRQSALKAAREQLKNAGMWDGIAPFVRGVSWRNFLVRYPESNRLHKLASRFSHAIALENQGKVASSRKVVLDKAQDHVWQAQCNCGYWHGVFGGLYLPHLRRGLVGNLARAEALLRGGKRLAERDDWDLDGYAEVLLGDASQYLSIHPGQGGITPVWLLANSGLNLSDSMTRQPEAYHARILGIEGKSDGAKLADQFDVSDPQLAAKLRYDATPRASGLVWWFPEGVDADAWLDGKESACWQGGVWNVEELPAKGAPAAHLWTEHGGVRFDRKIVLLPAGGMDVTIEVSNRSGRSLRGQLGHEWMVNFLAGDAWDRKLSWPGSATFPLGSSGATTEGPLTLADDWLQAKARVSLQGGGTHLWQGIHTVNQSVGGYETVYQGTAILGLRTLEVEPGASATVVFRLELELSSEPAPL